MKNKRLDSRFFVKAFVLRALLLIPFQLMVIRFADEPWPALSMPGFVDTADVPNHFVLREIYAVTVDDDRILVESDTLFPDVRISKFFSQNFSPRSKPPSTEGLKGAVAGELGSIYPFSNYWQFRLGVPHGNDADARSWMKQRLLHVLEGESITAVHFVWYSYEGFVRSDELPPGAVAETYVVDLR